MDDVAVSITKDVDPLSRRQVRAQLVEGLSRLDILGGHVRDHVDRWQVVGFSGVWLALDLRSDAGVTVARLEIENWRPEGVPSSKRLPTSVGVDIPWPIAREIGHASAATRQLRIMRGRVYWALEAQREDIHLAEQVQIDLLVAKQAKLSDLILKAAAIAARH